MATQYAVSIPNMLAEVHIVGRVVRDSEARFTPSGAKVANVSIAVSRRYLPQGQTEWQEQTAFYQLSVWGDGADRAGSLKKGDVVAATFSMADVEARSYESNGENKASLQISRARVSRFAYAGNGSGNGNGDANPAMPAEDDIAF
jgi:single-strand DNA-binding protein